MLRYATAGLAPILLYAAPAHAQGAQAEIDRATFFAGKAEKEGSEALFYFRNNRASYACTYLGSALRYTHRAITALNEARGMTRDAGLLRRIDSDLQARRGNRTAILEAGQKCSDGLAGYDNDGQ